MTHRIQSKTWFLKQVLKSAPRTGVTLTERHTSFTWSTRYRKTATEQTNNNNNNNNNSSTGDMSRHTNTSPATVSSPLLSDKFATIVAFIDHFNRVSFVVQALSLIHI